MALLEGVIETFATENGFGTIRLESGRTVHFDATAASGPIRWDVGSPVRAYVEADPQGKPKVQRLMPMPSLANPYTVLDDEDAEAVLASAERELETKGPSAGLRAAIAGLGKVLGYIDGDVSRVQKRIAGLLARFPAGQLDPGEPFGDGVTAEVRAMEPAVRAGFDALLAHAGTANASKPSAKWLKAAGPLVQKIAGLDAILARWFALVKTPPKVEEDPHHYSHSPPLSEPTSDILRGLVWIASLVPTREMAMAVGDLGATCFRKIPNFGAMSSKVGNACLWSLGAMSSSGIHGVAQLGRLKTRVKYTQALRLIEKALSDAAARAGISTDELLELGVPTCGLDDDGVSEEAIGDIVARITIARDGTPELGWVKNGKSQASVPAEVKADHADALKAVKARVKEIATLLPAQGARLEGMMMEPRDIPLAALRERYLDHGLVGRVARRLIWSLGEAGEVWTSGVFEDGRFVDVRGEPIDTTRIVRARLWHPLGRPPADVLAWRTFVAERGITQPFKQAHREIYVLTDAEIATDLYSNRFAAHVLKQHQLAALLRDRGWRYTLQGQWDSANTPFRQLRGLRVELFVEAAWESEQTSGAGIFLHVTTDQVRFLDDEGEPVSLRDVPALVFSEVMRDVDLFVGVASVGNDPSWRDQGPQAGHGYWQAYAFGELGASAETRRQVLGTLIPKLKVKDRLALEGRFLVVRGDLRTYKIHLGSGNILMEPNDQYLCIVPDRSTRALDLVLPFEGDGGLSIVLSKALLLAADKKIKDETILRQIRL